MSEQKSITILDASYKKQEFKRMASVPNVLFSKNENTNTIFNTNKSYKLINLSNIVEDYNSDDLDDDEWLAKKKEFWEKNKVTPLKLKDGTMKPEDLGKLLAKTFDE
jgi:hypothetical protein